MTNEQVDEIVLADIKRLGKARAGEILSTPALRLHRDPVRAVDRSLQRLRKRGLIELVGKPRRWQAVLTN